MENECNAARLAERAASDLDTGPTGGGMRRGGKGGFIPAEFCLALITGLSSEVAGLKTACEEGNITHASSKGERVNVTQLLEIYQTDSGVLEAGGGGGVCVCSVSVENLSISSKYSVSFG